MSSQPIINVCGRMADENACSLLQEYFTQGFASLNADLPEQLSLRIGYPTEEHKSKLLHAGDHYFLLADDVFNSLGKVQRIQIGEAITKLLNNLKYPKPVFVRITMNSSSEKPSNPVPAKTNTDNEEVSIEWHAEVPKYKRTQWIVSEQVNRQFDDALSIIRQHERIYRTWGFSEVDPNARAVLCFYGQPGTGKSMGAHVLAAELNMPIICASYAQIESKFMGQSPKRLRSVFAAAKSKNAVLFFDEADSFLGKRIEDVSQSADQAVNSLRGEMLILLEDFEGVVIFATNLHSNFDKAFDSRVLSHIEFELPNQEARKAIIKSKIPDKAPLATDVDEAVFDKLAAISDGFSGRELKNSVFMGLVKAAQRMSREGVNCIYAAELETAFEEVKSTRDKLAADRQTHGNPVKINHQGQNDLLKLAGEKIAERGEG